jgi:hypothetical protein
VDFIWKIIGYDGNIDNIDGQLKRWVEMAGEKLRNTLRMERQKKYGLTMEEAERIAIEFVKMRAPDATGGSATYFKAYKPIKQ